MAIQVRETPFQCGKVLDGRAWQEVRTRTIFECCKWDVQCEDHSVLAAYPLLIPTEEWRRLAFWAERLSREALLAEQELLARPDLLVRLGLPRQVVHLLGVNGRVGERRHNVRLMRFDFHYTTEGWRISEVNADVPGGLIEASGFTRLMWERNADTAMPPDVTRIYAEALVSAAPGKTAVLVHATTYSDDRQVMQYLSGVLSKCGMRVHLLSPAHLSWQANSPAIDCAFAIGVPDILVRFFPAEWLPSLGGTKRWAPFFYSETAISNPCSALLLQTKRFPLIWAQLQTYLSTWRELMPESVPVEDLAGSDTWVLKPALGRVGEDIAIPGITPEQELHRLWREARWRPSNWVAQARFEALPVMTSEGLRYPCFGVYTVNGKASGIYGRIAEKPLIDQDAQDVAVLLV
jgi:glutathionylspermidine synthase